MSEGRKLVLQVLSGPLDGAEIALETGSEWRRTGEGPLTFPWDAELGDPQARFTAGERGWYLQGLEAPHGTYRVNHEQRVTEKVPLERGDVLKASRTWLLVRELA